VIQGDIYLHATCADSVGTTSFQEERAQKPESFTLPCEEQQNNGVHDDDSECYSGRCAPPGRPCADAPRTGLCV